MIKSAVNPNQLSIDSMINGDKPYELSGLYKGDKVVVISGQYKGKSGRIYKMCSRVFPEWCRVEFDLTGRQRTKRIQMIQKIELKAIL